MHGGLCMEPKGQRESLGVFGDVLRVIWIRRRWSSDAADGGPRIAVNGSFKDAFCTFVHADSIWYGHQDAIGVVGPVCQILGQTSGCLMPGVKDPQ
jgi:hypothetical protein